MSKKTKAKRTKAKPTAQQIEVERLRHFEVERLRHFQEALAASAEDERRRLAAEVEADLAAAKTDSAWARLVRYLRG